LKAFIFNIVAGTCAILCISVLWLQINFHQYYYCQYSVSHVIDPGYTFFEVASYHGVLSAGFWVSRVNRTAPSPGIHAGALPDGRVVRSISISGLYPQIIHIDNLNGLGFKTFSVSIPDWLIAMLVALPLAFWLRPHLKRIRMRRRIQLGQCGICGYDLKLNVSGCCPECGSAFPLIARPTNG
jgi:hypothetical protein